MTYSYVVKINGVTHVVVDNETTVQLGRLGCGIVYTCDENLETIRIGQTDELLFLVGAKTGGLPTCLRCLGRKS